MVSSIIDPEAFIFLKKLAKNNNRDWFAKHKGTYLALHEQLVLFADRLLELMNGHDVIETPSGKKSLFRIYKDVRFSKDKTPYNTHWSGGFKRATKKLRGSYYFHLQPGNNFVMIGFWGPEPQDLNLIRQDIDYNYKEWKKMLASAAIKNTFGEMRGQKLLTSPRGFEPDHPAIELLRHKQFLLKHSFTDKMVFQKNFVERVNAVFKKARPFLDHMSGILAVNANGESIL